jgi:hypothetical protein
VKRDETCESTVVPRVNRLVLRLPGDPSLAGGTLAELNGLKSKLSKLQTCEAVRSSAKQCPGLGDHVSMSAKDRWGRATI